MTLQLPARTGETAPGPTDRDLGFGRTRSFRQFWSEVNKLDVLLGGLILLSGQTFAGGRLPFSVLLAVIFITVAAFRRPTRQVTSGGLMLLAVLAVYAFLILVSIKQGQVWGQRSFRFLLITGVAAALAQGRLDIRSVTLGACISSTINVPMFYLGLTSNYYPPYLTGVYGDKNVAGMYYVIWGVLGLMFVTRHWAFGWVLMSGTFVVLTGSRTAISAYVLALIWILLRNRVSRVIRLVLAGAGVWALVFVEDRFARAGAFSDRVGTDWYRAQIDQATTLKVDGTPWTGLGLNQGYVILGGVRRAWMHNSYAQAFVEGGYVFLGATIVFFGLIGLGLLSPRTKVSYELLLAEASLVAVMVCAWKLGETFMTTGAFIVLGMAIGTRYGRPLTASQRLRWGLPAPPVESPVSAPEATR